MGKQEGGVGHGRVVHYDENDQDVIYDGSGR